MRNLTFLFGILFISLISANGQDSFRKISIEKENVTLNTSNIVELYDSIFDDFESWYVESTSKEEEEEAEMDAIYNDIINTLDIIEQVEKELKEDILNDQLYSNLLKDIDKK